MRDKKNPGGSFALVGTSLPVNRMGYGAMQLAGQDGDKRVWGPPRDIPGAMAVLREAVASGVNHIDTSDFYGPHVTNQIIKQALHPYPDDLVIVTKVVSLFTASAVAQSGAASLAHIMTNRTNSDEMGNHLNGISGA